MNQKKSDETRSVQIAFYITFGVLSVFAVLIPHLIHNTYFLGENFVQSLAFMIVFATGYVFCGIYIRKIREIQEKKRQLEKRLTNSYAYIGEVNNVIEITKNFMNFPLNKKSNSRENEIFFIMLSNIINTIIKSNEGLIRLINGTSGKTIKDFHTSSGNNTLKISNKKLINSELNYLPNTSIMESSHKGDIRCFLAFPKQRNVIDYELLKSLLNQIYLLFLANRAENLEFCLDC